MHSFRIVNCDFYTARPISGLDTMYSEFRGSAIHQVPVIRIFGSSNLGVKTCLHIHGIFPYMYIPHDGKDAPSSLTYQIAAGLDKAINTSLGQATSNIQHIYKISLVSGIPMYGYHKKKCQFFKIYFYNPLILKKASVLLQNGNILNKIYQPHETHIPYILQFMIDYNLHGMSFINVSKLKYRYDSQLNLMEIPSDLILPHNITKMSVCEREIDILAENILNVSENVNRDEIVTNPGIFALWEEERILRKNIGQSSQISQCLTQTRLNTTPTDSNYAYKQLLHQRLILSSDVDDSCSGNSSVYPAETPEMQDLLEASFIDNHSPISSQNLVVNESAIEDEPSTILDVDAQILLNVLHDLKENVKELEDDSVLSQKDKIVDSDDETDLSMPLVTSTTPMKLDLKNFSDDDNDDLVNSSFFDKTLKLPQLDGNHYVKNKKGIFKINNKNKNKSSIHNNSKTTSRLSIIEDDVKQIMNTNKCKVYLSEMNFSEQVCCNKDEFVKKKNTSNVCNVKIVSQKILKKYEKFDINEIYESHNFRTINHLFCLKSTKPQAKFNLKIVDLNILMNLSKVKLVGNKLKAKKHKSKLQANEKLHKFNKTFKLSTHCRKLQSLDGVNDSSSDDNAIEELNQGKNGNISSNKSVSIKYTPLKITKNVSPKKTTTNNSFSLISEQPFRKIQKTKSNHFLQDFVKRQLSFDIFDDNSQESTNQTVFEEKLVCNLTPSKYINENIITNIELHNEVASGDSRNTITSSDIFSSSGETKDTNADQIVDSISMYSSKNSESFLDAVHKYDLKSNFIPKPGPSKSSNNNFHMSKLSTIWTPKNKPPNFNEILTTMVELKIPKVHNLQPFYGNVSDVTGSVEIGGTVLKLCSRTTVDIQPFDTIFDGIENIRKRQIVYMYPNMKLTKSQIINLKMKHCENRIVLITPLKRAPTRTEVAIWLDNACNTNDVTLTKQTKKKILIPSSPGMDNEDEDNSLTLTPFTPVEERDKRIKDADLLNTTPKSSKRIIRKNILVQNANNFYDISGATLDNTHGFKGSIQNYQDIKTISEHQLLTILIMELHVETRANFKPNPELDSIKAIFYKVINDMPIIQSKFQSKTGVISIKRNLDYINDCDKFEINYVEDELSLINKFLNMIQEWDPDILMGYEIEMSSWGYLIDRGYTLNLNLIKQLSRILNDNIKQTEDRELKITGRIVLDFWRLLRHEIALQSYTIENIVFHLLHQRIPSYSHKHLSYWWEHPSNIFLYKTVNYYITKLNSIVNIMDNLDLIGRTSELARLFGIQFYEVFSRGSQFRVESMMLRLAKPLNYIPVSPSIQQKAKMKAPESLPLIMEPESKFYADPVIVLDFQSLYPSMIIAYNYCFTTCLGKVNKLGKNIPFEFGATQLKVNKKLIEKLLEADQLSFSPCGVAFVKAEIRKGILPRMLEEILNTRLMVKKSMKKTSDNKTLKKVLHSRQLGLKLIANVTYGYTAANYSGRMPAVEIADSVVSKGRETLERAINLVENKSEWGAKVVYGDTDSLFVMVPGKSKEDAFKIGVLIADAVTNANPSPVKLKLEKVYQPCILQTKKRYVGYMYESPEQILPTFDAKGIETVRRDGCPAVSKMLEKCLKILFDTRDVSVVKKYVIRQFNKIISGRISIQDLTFAKEYRGASGYKSGACVPALELVKKWKATDPRIEPRCKERVPYVIVNGPPGLPLIRLVRSPYELIEDPSLRPNALYYITKAIIPAINRCFTLLGADLNTWFNEMPRKQIHYLPISSPTKQKKSTISQYFSTTACACCEEQTRDGLCNTCVQNPQTAMVILQNKLCNWEQTHFAVTKVCQSCIGNQDEIDCISLDCPIYYRRHQTEKDMQQTEYVRNLIFSFRDLN